MTPAQLRKIVWEHARKYGRHNLPWRRRTASPYAVLVSEIMLQQTQVDRVVPFYASFLRRFPTVRALAEAPLADVLRAWQGLGYNRRARMLHEAAKEIVRAHGGRVPQDVAALEALPGIGPYTARAVAAFAFNKDTVFVETNLRTVVFHHFYPDAEQVTDAQVLEVLTRALPRGRAREWYAALMDYGAHLKRSGVRMNARAKGYVRQSAFKGSRREARGAILRALAADPKPKARLLTLLGDERKAQMEQALEALAAEGFITKEGTRYRIA